MCGTPGHHSSLTMGPAILLMWIRTVPKTPTHSKKNVVGSHTIAQAGLELTMKPRLAVILLSQPSEH